MGTPQAEKAVRKMVATHTAAMVKNLPKDLYAPGLPRAVQYAAIEGFFANVRSLIEFLGVEGIKARRNSITAHQIENSWSPVGDPTTVATLKRHWVDATTHAMHFTGDRMDLVIVDQAALEKGCSRCARGLG